MSRSTAAAAAVAVELPGKVETECPHRMLYESERPHPPVSAMGHFHNWCTHYLLACTCCSEFSPTTCTLLLVDQLAVGARPVYWEARFRLLLSPLVAIASSADVYRRLVAIRGTKWQQPPPPHFTLSFSPYWALYCCCSKHCPYSVAWWRDI